MHTRIVLCFTAFNNLLFIYVFVNIILQVWFYKCHSAGVEDREQLSEKAHHTWHLGIQDSVVKSGQLPTAK